MRRSFALFLALALLFQMSWSVAATYCEHETSSKASMHFGHHVHVHKPSDAKKTASNQFAVDDDCSYCNAVHAAIIPMAPPSAAPGATAKAEISQPLLHGSATARAPDRPQWRRLA
ncbi:MAG: cobalt-zinc-cadmium resistance protein [Burkholderiaceae bacterium]